MGKREYNKDKVTWMVEIKHKTAETGAFEIDVTAYTKAEALQEAKNYWADIYHILGVRRGKPDRG